MNALRLSMVLLVAFAIASWFYITTINETAAQSLTQINTVEQLARFDRKAAVQQAS